MRIDSRRLLRASRAPSLLAVISVIIGLIGWAAVGEGMQDGVWRCGSKPVEPCFKHHGRLSSQNGIALKIWLIGTKRIVGLDNSIEDLPASIRKYLEAHIAGSQLPLRRL
jgi:hypothetical protein